MKLHCLGTTGYHPSASRHTACYYLPEASLLLDAGSGMHALTALLLQDPKESLDIFLSHAHLDHVFGLTFLLDTMAVTQLKNVHIYGLSEKLTAVREQLFCEHLFPVLPGTLHFHPIDDFKRPYRTSGGVDIDWFELEHPGGCLGYVLRWPGKSMAYVTDTVARPDAPYIKHIQDVDLLLHECYFDDGNEALAIKTGHSWLSAVTQLVTEVKAKRVALIHTNPLAEDVLHKPMKLSKEHLALGMSIPTDGECISF